MDVALYFPYISIPPGPWFTRTLLYWDGVASVVPERLSDRDAELTPFMRDLVAAQLVRPVAPEQAQFSNQNGFDHRFLTMLDDSGVAGDADEPWPSTRMHREKATWPLFEEIADRQLGHWDHDSHEWFVMEQRTADLYMAYLVGSICRVDQDLIPVTDARDNLEQLACPVRGSKPEQVKRLEATMKRRKWPVLLAGAAALGAPALGIGAAVVTGGAALAIGLGVGRRHRSGRCAATLPHRPRIDQNSPVAYAALAGRLKPTRPWRERWPWRRVQ